MNVAITQSKHRSATNTPSRVTVGSRQSSADVSKGDEERDNEQSNEEDEDELSWRMNPNKSMSDWTIEIQTVVSDDHHVAKNPTTTTTVYHVHKSVLAVGPRRSQYFVKLFRATTADTTSSNTNTTVAATTTTRIEMEELTAMAFPIVLDYMYGTSSSTTSTKSDGVQHQSWETIPIATHNATALHVLAQQLDMKQLRTIVRTFWMQDLSMDTIAIYYQHASSLPMYQKYQNSIQNKSSAQYAVRRVIGGGLDDPLIIRALEMYCAQHLFDVDSGNCTIADILDLIDPQFLYNVIVQARDNHTKSMNTMMNRRSNEHQIDSFSLRLSLIIAVYCNVHYEIDLDEIMFQQLTDSRHLPVLESQAAKVFLELQEKLFGVPNTAITSLTDRCITVLAHHWDEACITSQQETNNNGNQSKTTVTLPRLESAALEAFVSKSFLNASGRIFQYETSINDLHARVSELGHKDEQTQNQVNMLEEHNEQLQQQIRELQKELETMKQHTTMSQRIQPPHCSNSSTSSNTSSSTSTSNPTANSEHYANGLTVEYTDDASQQPSSMMIETNIWQPHTATNLSDHEGDNHNLSFQSPSRNAIHHGRLLLQRLDSPAHATTINHHQ
jgi:BTB/POZ domain